MPEPREIAEALEREAVLEGSADERFEGYGVMGVSFAGGDILAMRRFVASSVGASYTSIWHRSPDGRWTFYSDNRAEESCARYFSAGLTETRETPILIEWTGARSFMLSIERELRWEIALAPSAVTGALNWVGGVLPARLWGSNAFLRVMGVAAGVALRAGKMGLAGRTPNGQWFQANPKLVWLVSHSSATVGGRDLGVMGDAGSQASLADFWIPKRGLFAAGKARFERFDPTRHRPLSRMTDA